MANWFENITKTLADGKLSRRQMMTKMAGFTTATALAALIPAGEAFAATPDKRSHSCKYPGCCSCDQFMNCDLKKYGNTNCYCFQKLGPYPGVCGCNTYCSSLIECIDQASCPTGYTCITSTGCGCTQGFCIQKCNKTCTLASNGAGRTAA
jgi:hypothetical protein